MSDYFSPSQGAGPDPKSKYPLTATKQVAFLKPVIDHPMIEVGDYTYYDDPRGPERFVENCVHYHFPHMGDRLVIGRFCAIAANVQFIMNGANHSMSGFSTFPFSIFGNGWDKEQPDWKSDSRGDTCIGNDVWIGREAMIMPGVSIGDGAIIGAGSVVASAVAPYAIVAGNPAREFRLRFDAGIIERLLAVAWWNWSVEKITEHLSEISSADIEALERAALS